MAPRDSARPSSTIVQFPDRRRPRIVRISAELDGLCILYTHHALSQDKLFALRILCWGLRENGEVVALFPWLNRLYSCRELTSDSTGEWRGYYNPDSGAVFHAPPEHKVLELEAGRRFFGDPRSEPADSVLQELPDAIGSHAVTVDEARSLKLHEVLSWRLLADGRCQAMLADPDHQQESPVLPGDQCLYPAQDLPEFRYFFQYHIANQIKSGDPVAVRALARLLGE